MPRQNRSILLIEDSDTQALLFAETLKAAGMSVHRVATAEAGLEYLQSNRPALAIVDYHLPGMQGHEFCRVIRDSNATDSIPLLILTDDTRGDAEQYVLDCGADDYVAKSKDPDILLARIDLLLRRSQRQSPAQIDETSFYKAQRVLLVDDSPTYLAFLEDELGHDGYRIFTANGGEAAVQIAWQNHIDCAVIDLVMPGMDGIELCRRLVKMRKPGRSLPVLIITAQGSKEKMMESLEVGADDYVEKSGDPTVLKARLRALLRRKMLQDEHQRIQDEIRDKELELVRERARNEAHLRAILDNAADGIITIDTGGLIRTFNKAAEKIFGYSAQEAIGRNVSMLMPQKVAEKHDGYVARYLADSSHPRIVGLGPRGVDAERRDGSTFPAEFSVGEIKTDADHLFVGVLRDVTERRRAEEALRAADEQIHLLLDSVGEGVYGVDTDGKATFVNRSTVEMLGFAEDELIGNHAHEIFHHSRADGSPYPAEECANLKTIRTGEAREGVEDTFWKKDGTSLPVQLSSRPVRRDGELVGAVVSFQDVSHRKDLEARLRQSQKMEAIGRLTGGVAHDFNNLLTVIIGNLQLLGRSLGDSQGAVGRIDKIMGAAKSGADLTRRLLTFSRQQVLETGTVDVNELVEDTGDMLRRTMGENIAIKTSLSSDRCLGRSDRNQLQHALLNLCVNARDAMPDGGCLTIETRRVCLDEAYAAARNELRPGRYIEVAVSDTGTGIAPEIIDKIFEPFFTTKEKGEGTGLGLSTIFGFMKQSDGHVSVYSEIGHGATFKLYVAEAEDEDAVAAVAEPKEGRSGAGNRHATILVVEDEEGVRDIAVSMLADAGYDIIEANNGAAGLQAFSEHPEIDLVFSDVIMPGGMSGPEMVELIRKQRPDIPVLFASGYAEQALRDRETLIPHSKFVAKPYDSSELPERIGSLLEAGR
ncbi:MAG: response regulator [Bauldia sp.]